MAIHRVPYVQFLMKSTYCLGPVDADLADRKYNHISWVRLCVMAFRSPSLLLLHSPHSSPDLCRKMISVFPSYTISGFIALVLVLVPLPRQIRAGNIAMIAMTFWFFQHCLAVSVNTIVWRGNVNDVAPIWCDITSTLRDGVVMALPACTLCICKHLEFISSRRPINTLNPKLRRTIFELTMCFGIPSLWIFIGYCFRGYRYIIIEDFGCYSSSWLSDAYVTVFLAPTLAVSVVNLGYASIALYHLFNNHRINTKILTPHLRSRDSGLSGTQYYRLMIMCIILGLWGVVWICMEIHAEVAGGISPLPNWSAVHQNVHIPFEITAASMSQSSLHFALLMWWGIPGGAYLYFVLFGTSMDVLAEYSKLWMWVRTKVLRLPPPVRREMSSLTAFTVPWSRTAFSRSLSVRVDTTVLSDDLESKGGKLSPSHSDSEAVN